MKELGNPFLDQRRETIFDVLFPHRRENGIAFETSCEHRLPRIEVRKQSIEDTKLFGDVIAIYYIAGRNLFEFVIRTSAREDNAPLFARHTEESRSIYGGRVEDVMPAYPEPLRESTHHDVAREFH